MAKRKRQTLDVSELLDRDLDLEPIPAYDIAHEKMPDSVLLSKEYIFLQQGAQYLYQLLTEPLAECRVSDTVTEQLTDSAQRCLLSYRSEQIMVSIRGNMGSGKSSLINSLYGVGELARAKSAGASCTLVPHVFCGRMENQATPFIAKVTFLTAMERTKFLRTALAAFYRAVHASDDTEIGGSSPAQAAERVSEEDLETRDYVARAINAIFSSHEECATVAAAKQFLGNASCEDDAVILEKMEQWARQLVEGETCGRDSVVVEASTAEDLAVRLELYTVGSSQPTDDEPSSDGPSLWPLVSSVSCHFDSVFSKQGISFLDAAGSGDHRLRTDTSLELRRQCLYSLVVVGSARAANDPSVSKLVKEAKSKRDGRLIIVVTSSDMIDDAIVGGTTTDRENLADLQEAIAEKQGEISNVTQQRAKTKDKKLKFELTEQREDLQARLKLLKDSEKALHIEMRSADTKARNNLDAAQAYLDNEMKEGYEALKRKFR